MKQEIRMKKEIEELFKSDISTYKINKETGISLGSLSELRNGVRNIENISLKNASKLYEFYLKNLKKNTR